MGEGMSHQQSTQNNKNLLFYRNEIKSQSGSGYKIEEMLKWHGNYTRLEKTMNYLQWLFPIQSTRGTNNHAQLLQREEAEAIYEDTKTRSMVLLAYKMMLDFYGIKLNSRDYGVERADNYEARYAYFNKYKHNVRSITRILTSLCELGFEKYQGPLVMFLLEEAIENELLHVDEITLKFWVSTVKDDDVLQTILNRWNSLR